MLYNPLPVWKDALQKQTGCRVFSLEPGSQGIFRVAGTQEIVKPDPIALAVLLLRWQRETILVAGEWHDYWRAEQTLLAQMTRKLPCPCDAAAVSELLSLPGDIVYKALQFPRLFELKRKETLARRVREFAAALRVARSIELARYRGAKPPNVDILWAPLCEGLSRFDVGVARLPFLDAGRR